MNLRPTFTRFVLAWGLLLALGCAGSEARGNDPDPAKTGSVPRWEAAAMQELEVGKPFQAVVRPFSEEWAWEDWR